MKFLKYILMNEAGEGGDGGAPATSVLGGAAAGDEGNEQSIDSLFPEKYRVLNEGKFDIEQSAKKLAEGYTNLEKRFGSGNAAPKTPEEYAPVIEAEGFDIDAFKADPDTQSFLKGAHAKGLSNDQISYVLNEYVKNVSQLSTGNAALDSEAATAELKKSWSSDQDLQKNVGLALKAFNAFASPEDRAAIDQIGNNPLVIRLLAKVGAEMEEDRPVDDAGNEITGESIKDLMRSDAYRDPKHQDHAKVSRIISDFYRKTAGNEAVY